MQKIQELLVNMPPKFFGNNIFRPGDIIYLEPNYIFNNIQTIDLEETLGIGGYYLVIDVKTNINDSNFTTNLSCVFKAHVDKKEKDKSKRVKPLDKTCVKSS